MSLLESVILSKLAGSLTSGVLRASGRALRKTFATPEGEKAIGRCSETAIQAFLDEALPSESELPREHVEDLLEKLARNDDVHSLLADLLKGVEVPPEDLRELFADTYDVETLPGLDLQRGSAAFAVAFVDRAIEEESLQPVLQTGHLREQTDLLREILEEVKRSGEGGGSSTTARVDGLGAAVQGSGTAAGAGGTAIGKVVGDVHFHSESAGNGSADLATLYRTYLTRCRREWQVVPIAALGGEESAGEEVTLDQVYVDLDTTARVARGAGEAASAPQVGQAGSEEETRSLTALEAIELDARVVLLGKAGSGKSTFVKVVLSRLAAAQLGEAVEPPAGLDRDLFPVLLVCRDLSSRLAGLDLGGLSAARRREALSRSVREQAEAELARLELGELRGELATAWEAGRCLLVIDGLDEVPQSLREQVGEAVLSVCRSSLPDRVIVTCRVRSYRGSAMLPGFTARTLAPFDGEKIRGFCEGWYEAQKELGRVDRRTAQHRWEDLARAALGKDLAELSENPMLLTTLALVHQRGVVLPDHRVELYEKAIGVLTEKWQRSKVGERLVPSEEVAAVLKEKVLLGRVLQRLAVEALEVGGTVREEESGLPREKILTLLEDAEYLGSRSLAQELLDYVDQRAGLLVGHGGEPGRHRSYGFPHRTFQEYLAGRWLVSQWYPVSEIFERAAEGDLWSLAVELGAESLLWVDGKEEDLLRLAYELGRLPERDSEQWRRAVLWSGRMAALVGQARLERKRGGPVAGGEYLAEMRPRWVGLLASDLPARERVEAGRVLLRLGDPRFSEEHWCLPLDPLLGFVEVPAGVFLMGSDPKKDHSASEREQRQHELDLPRYFVGRYPVTVGQYQKFVESTGFEPGNRDCLVGESSEPVVRVSWGEALSYGRWLGGCLRELSAERRGSSSGELEAFFWGGLLRGELGVGLPSEAEWEKASRGVDGRIYPWGGELAPDRANYDETGLGARSVVGSFGRWSSPYGCEEMVGNVWEWTRSLWGKSWEENEFGYPYVAEDGREDLEADGPRVVRGGSFLSDLRNARCAVRLRNFPGSRFGYIGFRLVVSPFFSGL